MHANKHTIYMPMLFANRWEDQSIFVYHSLPEHGIVRFKLAGISFLPICVEPIANWDCFTIEFLLESGSRMSFIWNLNDSREECSILTDTPSNEAAEYAPILRLRQQSTQTTSAQKYRLCYHKTYSPEHFGLD